MNFLKKYFWMFLAALIVVVDQITKFAVAHYMQPYDEKVVLQGLFSIFYVRNEGVAFGLLSEFGALSKILVAILTTAIVVAAIVLLCRGKLQNKLGVISAAMVIGGGIGNLIDRVRLRYVIDFFAFSFKGWQFAVFNVADIFVTVGTILFLIYFVFLHKDKPKQEENDGVIVD